MVNPERNNMSDEVKIPDGEIPYSDSVFLWEYLSQTEKPIVMYGMGDGAIKIMNALKDRNITPAAFMASDEFVRGHEFLGYRVKKLSEIEAEFSDFIILVCFGSALPEVTERLYSLAEKHELYAPDVPVIDGGLFDRDYITHNAEKIKQVRELFADDKSREVFDNWAKFRLCGDIGLLRSCETEKEEAYSLLKLKSDEIYVDLGAYTGDTVEEFLNITERKFRKIYALEPDLRSFTKMRRRHYQLAAEQFEPINAAAWEKDETVDFIHRGGRNSAISGKGRLVPTRARSVDSVLGGEKATLIKLDVEGCEEKALLGAEKTIRLFKPKLIVSLYHRNGDMLDLPLLVKKLNSGYRLYLRHHPYIPAWDTNLYCL